MEKIFLWIVLAMFMGWSWSVESLDDSMENVGWEQEYGGGEQEESREEDPRDGLRSRGVFSSYIVSGLDCMDDGTYDAYVEYQVNAGNDSGSRSGQETQDPEDTFPTIYFGFMGLDLKDYAAGDGQGGYYGHKAFCSDKFYMEYPGTWYVGSTDACPLTFVPEWEEEASGQFIHDWIDYFDENLVRDIDDAQEYIENGGINSFLEEVMGEPVSGEYEIVTREKDSGWLLICDLKKGGDEAAEIVVWCNLGKLSIRRWNMELTVDPEEDYGRILVFQEWDRYDFSSAESIEEYVQSEDFLFRLLGTALEEDVKEDIISFETGTFTNLYHDFVRVQVGISDMDRPEQLLRQAEVYIPVTEDYNDNWVVVFESFPGSRQENGVADQGVRERVMSTFVVLPYYHQVEEGENLSDIARLYGEDPDLAYQIAAYQTNNLSKPDQIRPGQKIEIPLGVLFRRVHH